MESMLVRHLGALRRAIDSLDAYYQEYRANPYLSLRNPTHPYPNSFTSPDKSANRFIFLFHMKGRNLFSGRMDDGTAICIKFVARYCKEGMQSLFSKKLVPRVSCGKSFAPKLPAVGLYMVVTDDVSEEYVSLFNLVRDNLVLLSEEHLVARNCLSDNACGNSMRLALCMGIFAIRTSW